MSVPVLIRREAERDIREIGELIGRKFLERIVEVLDRIGWMPEIYGKVWRDVRGVRLRRLRYVLYYVVLDARVEVIAVIHGSRDESAWQSRV